MRSCAEQTASSVCRHGHGPTTLQPFRFIPSANCEVPGTCMTGRINEDGNSALYTVGAGQCLGVTGSLKVLEAGEYTQAVEKGAEGYIPVPYYGPSGDMIIEAGEYKQESRQLESTEQRRYYSTRLGSFNDAASNAFQVCIPFP
jgi:hypothetical protein